MSTGPRVLLVDDDADFRSAVRSLLETQGYRVSEAGSGKEGLRRLLEVNPELILLDVMMECSCEGYGITHAIKHQDEYAACRGVPIIMISSIAESPDERFRMCSEAELIRPDCYLTKPLDVPKFLETVAAAVAGARAAHAAA